MSENTDYSAESEGMALNHLDNDVTSTRVETPLLPEQTLKCKTGDVHVRVTGQKKQKRLSVPLELLEEGKDDVGEPVFVGTIIPNSFLVEESGGWDNESINRELKRTKMAALGLTEKEAAGPIGDVRAWSNKEVLVRFSIREDKKTGDKFQQARLMAVKQG